MAFKLPNNCKQLSATSGTGSYTFSSTPAGYATWESQLSNGDTTWYFARDSSNWEVGSGTFSTGPATMARTLIASSTGSLISWPGSGTREVGCSISGEALVNLLSHAVTSGIPVKTAAYAWAFRTLANGTYITWTNPAGTAGNPTLVDSALDTNFLRRNTAATMAAQLSLDYFSAGIAVLGGSGSENMLKFTRAGATDYTMHLQVGSAYRRLLVANASDLNDADRLQTATLVQARTLASYGSSNRYVSPEQTITSATLLTLAHGLGVVPERIDFRLICKSAEGNWSANDQVYSYAPVGEAGTSNRGWFAYADATNVYVRFGSNAQPIDLKNKTTGTTFQPTVTATVVDNWKLVVYAYA